MSNYLCEKMFILVSPATALFLRYLEMCGCLWYDSSLRLSTKTVTLNNVCACVYTYTSFLDGLLLLEHSGVNQFMRHC